MTARISTGTFPIEEVARRPLPGMAVPDAFAFSPSDRLITYLYSPERSLVRQLYAFDPENGEHFLLVSPPEGGTREENLSLEEALRRERIRQLELGVTQYSWSKSGDRLLVPARGAIYVKDAQSGELRVILEGADKPALDPQFSPDGQWVAYLQDAELYVVPAEGGHSRQLTFGARGTGRTHGEAEFIAQEEMQRNHGYWWSPDSRWIAFTEVDETHIPVYRIIHQGKDFTGDGAQEDHRYPFAGEANAIVRLAVVPVEGGEPVWMDLGENRDIYLARVRWFPDGRLSAQLQNREQNRLDLVVFDPSSGERLALLTETSQVWINLHDMFRPLKGSFQGHEGCFVWASERSGFQHLYLYDREGKLIHPLTSGEWMVDEIAGVDEEAGLVYFISARLDPRERHLYAVPLAGGEPRRITQEPGVHRVVIDRAHKRFVDTLHSIHTPPRITLCSLPQGDRISTLFDQVDPRVARLKLKPPELVELENRHGDRLYGAVYHPPAQFGEGPYPTLVWVYGGPHAQLVVNAWQTTVQMRVQYLSELGFLVFVLDNRGSARRGLAFESVIWHKMGVHEVEDQVDGVRWLVEQGLADPDRVGVFGWSYGGFMSLMCLAQAPEIFKAAVAGAPVTHYGGYDTHYTERYMGTPQTNPDGYQRSSVMNYVDGIQGKLLLVHGLIDENVHFRHTARLINALIAARKPYELMLFPDERHSPRRLEDRVYMEERIRDFFIENLMNL